MERILIGTITKPQALKGAFRLKPEILNTKSIKKLKTIYIDSHEYVIESVTDRDAFLILKIAGVETCEQAEMLRNKQVFADIEVEKNENLDLQGFEVVVGAEKGVILDINNYGATDIFTIKLVKTCMVPAIDKLISNIDYENKIVNINEEIFNQVVVYEN